MRRHLSGIVTAVMAMTLAGSTITYGQSDQTADLSLELPQAFTARLGCGEYTTGEPGSESELADDPGTTVAGLPLVVWRFPTLQVSDARMGGRTYGYLAGTEWANESWAEEVGVYSALWHVVNDGGEWIGPYSTLRSPELGYATNAIRLEGYGGYEGLYAVIQADFRDDCGWDVDGYILERDVPPFPEPAEALRP